MMMNSSPQVLSFLIETHACPHRASGAGPEKLLSAASHTARSESSWELAVPVFMGTTAWWCTVYDAITGHKGGLIL